MEPETFLPPTGDLEPRIILGEGGTVMQLHDRLEGWITRASVKAAGNEVAARAYVYHLAYGYVADRLASAPAAMSVDAGTFSRSISAAQIEHFQRLSNEYLAEFEEALGPTGKPRRLGTIAVRNTFSW